MEWNKALLLIMLSLSGWTALALLLDRRGYAAINRCVALLLLCLCVPQLYIYSRLVEPPTGNLALALAAQATLWLKGPLLWGIVGLVTLKSLHHLGLQFLPFLLVLAAMLLRPDWASTFTLAGYIHALVYLILALGRLWRSRERLHTITTGHVNSAYYWLVYVLAGLLLLVMADLVLMTLAYVQLMPITTALLATALMISAYTSVIAFFSIYRPEIFFLRQPEQTASAAAAMRVEPEPTDKAWRELDAPLAQLLAERLTRLMEENQLYRQNELSLRSLAECLDVTVHQLSELLNLHFGVSFYGFLNRYRLVAAQRLLANPQCQLRIVDIAFEAGFSNKNSFYRSFREHAGMTPAEYRSRHLKQTADAAGAESS